MLYRYGDNNTFSSDIVMQPDGKMLVSGHADVDGNWVSLVVRLTIDGQIDNTFNGTGAVSVDHGTGIETSVKVLLQGDGKIILCSRSADQQNSMIFDRFNTDGSVDNSFGTNGSAIYTFTPSPGNSATMYEAILMPNDDIVASGAVIESNSSYDYGIVRLNGNDGSIQTTWGDNGMIVTDFTGTDDKVRAMAMTPDGRLVAAGSTVFNTTTNYTATSLARYTIGLPSSVAAVQNDNSLKVYPNPSNGVVSLQNDGAATLNIVNALGQKVKTVELNAANNFSVTIQDLPQGIFFIQSTDGAVKGKIVSL